MQTTSIQKFVHTSPRKMRLVADMARKMEPNHAVEILQFTHKAAAVDLVKAIKVSLANARNIGMETVNFKSIEINEGPKMKRFRAGTRGRAKPYIREMSHIKIVLTDEIKVKENVIASEVKDERGNLPSQEDSDVAKAPRNDKIKKARARKESK